MIASFVNPFFSDQHAGVIVVSRGKAGKPGFGEYEAATSEEVARIAQEWAAAGSDVFFSYVARKPGMGRRGDDSMAYGYAFALDIDVREDKPSGPKSNEQALRAVMWHKTQGHFPMPSRIVMSGGGVHLYWFLDQPLLGAEWKAKARQFAARLASLPCEEDWQHITGDLVRTKDGGLLRLPGSMNYKYAPPRHVQVLDIGEPARYSLDQLLGGASFLQPRQLATRSKPTAQASSSLPARPAQKLTPPPSNNVVPFKPLKLTPAHMNEPIPVKQPWRAQDMLDGCALMKFRLGAAKSGRPELLNIDSYDWWFATGQAMVFASGPKGIERSKEGLLAWAQLSGLRGVDGTDYIAEAGGTQAWFHNELAPKYLQLCQSIQRPPACETYQQAAFSSMPPSLASRIKAVTCGRCPHNGQCRTTEHGVQPVNLNTVAMDAYERRLREETRRAAAQSAPVPPAPSPAPAPVTPPQPAPLGMVVQGDFSKGDATPDSLASDALAQKLDQHTQQVVLDPILTMPISAAQPFHNWLRAGPKIMGGKLGVDAQGRILGSTKDASNLLRMVRTVIAPLGLSGETMLVGVQTDPAKQELDVIELPMLALTSATAWNKSPLAKYAAQTSSRAQHVALLREALLEYHMVLQQQDGEVRFGLDMDADLYTAGRYQQSGNGQMSYAVLNDLQKRMADKPAYIGTRAGSPAKQFAIWRYYWRYGNAEVKWYLAAALGGLLRPMLDGSGGTIINLYGGAGTGKSHVLNVAAGLFGRPRPALRSDSTAKVMSRILGVMHGLPMCLDEFAAMSGEDRLQFAYNVTDAGERAVSTQDGTGVELSSAPYVSSAMLNSNKSFFASIHSGLDDTDMIAAIRRRVVDINIGSAPTLLPPSDAQRAFIRMRQLTEENYGWIGPWFARYVLANKAAIQQMLRDKAKEFEHFAGISQANFWAATMACASVAAAVFGKAGVWGTEKEAMDFMDMIGQRLMENSVEELKKVQVNVAPVIETIISRLSAQLGHNNTQLAEATWEEVSTGQYRNPGLLAKGVRILNPQAAGIHTQGPVVAVAADDVMAAVRTVYGSRKPLETFDLFIEEAKKQGVLKREGQLFLPHSANTNTSILSFVFADWQQAPAQAQQAGPAGGGAS